MPFSAHLTVPNIMFYNVLYVLSRQSEFYKEVLSQDGRQSHIFYIFIFLVFVFVAHFLFVNVYIFVTHFVFVFVYVLSHILYFFIFSRPSEFYKEVVSQDCRQGHNGHMPQRRELRPLTIASPATPYL